MSNRGRKPRPTDLKILSGDRADRVNRSEPKPRRSAPVCPDHLDEWGREAWDRITRQLGELGILSASDSDAIALYCATYSRWRAARREIAQTGITATTDLGSLKSNPAVAVATQAERMMASLLAEFGLTPSSRSRVKADTKAQDALGEFLARRKG